MSSDQGAATVSFGAAASETEQATSFPGGESAFRALFDANSDALFVHDPLGRVLLVNAQACAMFGCEPEQAPELSIGQLSSGTPPYTQTDAKAKVARAIQEGAAVFEWQTRRLSGEVFWSEIALRSFDLGGKTYVIACIRDISARKTMEEALRASEERFAAIFHHQSNMLAFTEPTQGRILDVNDTWLEATGLTRQQALGRTGRELGLWADLRDREAILGGLEKNARIRDHEVLLRLGGKTVPALISVEKVALRDERYFVWEIRDISQQRHAEAERERLRGQLVQAQKMESVGRLAGGVAHDFNNLLTVINGCTGLLMLEVARDDDRWGLLSDIQQAGERAAGLTRQLLAFSRRQVMQPRDFDVNEVLSEAEQLLRRLIGEDVKLLVLRDPGLGQVHADPNLINQVVMNLAINARDAMPNGGKLTIETRNTDIKPGSESPHEVRPGRYVELTVSDSGTGMDEAVQRRLFEPFFTTKPQGRGTGLGLSTVYGIVEQAGGFISVESQRGRGSRFHVYLPRIDPPVVSTQAPSVHDPAVRGTEIVLVVEDQADVRRFVRRVLARLGYVVLEAENPDEVARLSAEQPRIDILVTDVIMPGLSGRALADRLRESHPDLRVLFMSGYTDDVVMHHGVVNEGAAFLQKPFNAADLGRKVHAVLTAPPSGRSTA